LAFAVKKRGDRRGGEKTHGQGRCLRGRNLVKLMSNESERSNEREGYTASAAKKQSSSRAR